MLALLLRNFKKTGKKQFSIDDIKEILKLSFVDDTQQNDTETKMNIQVTNNYNFLKTVWYYGYKKLNKNDIFKTVVLRIQQNYIDQFRNLLSIDQRQQFNHYDTKPKNNSEFDLSDCPPMDGSDEDIYSSHPSIKVCFANLEEFDDFRNKLGDRSITHKTKTVWYPDRPTNNTYSGKWICNTKCENKYPIYIPSFKRSDSMHTVKSLLDLDIDNFYVVIRPIKEEITKYTSTMEMLGCSNKLLIVPQKYIDDQEKIGNFNSIPQRNYAYQHSKDNNHTHHWCLDDNIKGFYRRHKGVKLPFTKTAYPFTFVEQYIQRYTNIYLASLQYSHLVPANGNRNIIIVNSKVYSCILIKNDNNIMWKGSYNEDIILTLDTLTQGKATMTFQNFLCGKLSTGSTKGGNQDIYSSDGQTKKIDALMHQYPQYTKKIQKYGHPHHQVDYTSFKNIDLGYKKTKLTLPELHLIN